MNREIKFRVWDTSERIMSAGVPFSWFITGHPEDMLFPTTKETLPLHDFVRYFGDFILMQFTGITDNFHKAVYDGDIFQTVQGSLFVVNWNEEECQWTALCFSGDHQGFFYPKKFMGENMEVIGNTYENSDLLLNR